MPDTNGFSTQEEIDASTERLRRSKGRMVEPLPTYRFKNGAVATIHHIGQMTIAHVAAGAEKKIPKIPVPTFMEDLGEGPKPKPNPTDHAYQQAVASRGGQVNLAVMDALIELAVEVEIDHAALDRLNATMELIGMPLDEVSEKVAFIKHCCITDGSELGKLANLIKGELEEAVEAATATFSSDIPAATAQPLELAVLGSPV
jgi:hypothetical protein